MNLELRKSLSKLKDDSSFNLLFESYEKDFQEIGTYFNTPKRELDTYLEASYKNLKHSDNLITRLHLLTLAKYACPNVDTTPYLLEELENYKIRNSISLTTDEERTEASLQRNLLARLLARNYRDWETNKEIGRAHV